MRAVSVTALLLAGCQQDKGRVDAADYEAYWLWAGVKSQPLLDRAKTIYILEGEVRARKASLVKLRGATPMVKHADLWMVYRVETLDWGDDVLPQMLRDLARWKAAGNRVIGIQIDFDAATKGLESYADFLQRLRQQLPADCKLGVTGLLDWSSQGDSIGLNALATTVDEVVLQTYQGRHTIEGYQGYLSSLDRLEMPYKIGLVQNGEWDEPNALANDPDFKGYVVFLINASEQEPGPRISKYADPAS
jgi:hypothetical protein